MFSIVLLIVFEFTSHATTKIPNEGTKTQAVKRNELSVLKRFELVTVKEDIVYPNSNSISKSGGAKEAIWAAAKNESSLLRCIEIIQDKPDVSAKDMAAQISDEYNLNWSEGSKTRNGGVLKQWSCWVKEGMELSGIPSPTGRPNKSIRSNIETNAGV